MNWEFSVAFVLGTVIALSFFACAWYEDRKSRRKPDGSSVANDLASEQAEAVLAAIALLAAHARRRLG